MEKIPKMMNIIISTAITATITTTIIIIIIIIVVVNSKAYLLFCLLVPLGHLDDILLK